MEWTKDDVKRLLEFKNTVDSDDIKIKEQIKHKLVSNRYIAHVLNNKELEDSDANPEDYFGVNIFPYYIVYPTQHNVQNFICYEVTYRNIERYNSALKELDVMFYILCECKNIIDSDTGIARHDLLAALITDQFNHTNIFGKKISLVSDIGYVTDDQYALRTLTFEQVTDNNFVKTKNGVSKLSNKDIVQ